MKATTVVVTTVLAFTLLCAVIVGWSMRSRTDVKEKANLVVHLNDANFQKNVVEASKTRPILVDFYADWCLPCRFLDPILQEVAQELGDRAVIGKVNSDENLIARRFRVSSIPVMFIIKDAEIKERIDGLVPKESIIEALKKHGA